MAGVLPAYPPLGPAATADPGEAGQDSGEAGPDSGEAGPEPAGDLDPAPELVPPTRARIDDRWLMATLIPGFGLAISHATELFGALGPRDAAWWWGHAWFIGGAGLIYLANRALLFWGRGRASWFRRPAARLGLLLAGIAFGTLPTTWGMLQGWTRLSGVPLGDNLRLVMLTNVICVLFVTWLYETLFLVRERVDDQTRVATLSAARTQAELAALRAQVDPHFLFNALNTLAGLVESRPAEARRFVDHLATVYRALLDTRGCPLVPLEEELGIAAAYAELLHIRFGEAVRVRFDPPRSASVPPGALQVLLENAVRHNRVDPAEPLLIDVAVTDGAVEVSHPRRPRAAPGAGTGLANLDARVRAATGRRLQVEAGARFLVRVPLA